jgi:hypothetical protein
MDLEGKSIIRQKSFMEAYFATKRDKTPLFDDKLPQKIAQLSLRYFTSKFLYHKTLLINKIIPFNNCLLARNT